MATIAAPTASPRATALPMSRGDALTFAVFGAWSVVGLFLDGWAHNAEKPETFFTPWHGVLYSGVTAGVVWGLVDRQRRTARGEAVLPFAGARLTVLGGVLFGIGAAADFGWHAIFGIEDGIEALLSPTHLALMVGGLLVLTAPLRAALLAGDDPRTDRPERWRDLGPVVVTTTLAAAVGAFFLMYMSAFQGRYLALPWDPNSDSSEILAEFGIAAVLITAAILTGPMLVLARRWILPPGAITFMWTGIAALSCGLEGFEQWSLVPAATIGGLMADVLIARRASIMTIAIAANAGLWPAYFLFAHVGHGLGWSAELWSGTVILAVTEAAALAALASPRPTRPLSR